MQVKTIKKITGISDGDIATAWGSTDLGAVQVNCFISGTVLATRRRGNR